MGDLKLLRTPPLWWLYINIVCVHAYVHAYVRTCIQWWAVEGYISRKGREQWEGGLRHCCKTRVYLSDCRGLLTLSFPPSLSLAVPSYPILFPTVLIFSSWFPFLSSSPLSVLTFTLLHWFHSVFLSSVSFFLFFLSVLPLSIPWNVCQWMSSLKHVAVGTSVSWTIELSEGYI